MIIVDARGLPPPEPFERVIDALGRMGHDESVRLIVDREPLPLLRFLAQCTPGRTLANMRAIVALGLYSRARLKALRQTLGPEFEYDHRVRAIRRCRHHRGLDRRRHPGAGHLSPFDRQLHTRLEQ